MENSLTLYIICILSFSCMYFAALKKQDEYGKRTTGAKFLVFICYLLYISLATFRPIQLIDAFALRYTGGVDAYHTKVLFERYAENWTQLSVIHGEIGFKFLQFVCYKISSDFRFFLFIFHSIAFLLFNTFFKKTKGSKKSLIFVVLISGMLFTMFNTMRHDLVALMWLVAFSYYKEDKKRTAYFILLVSVSFHLVTVFAIWVLITIELLGFVKGKSKFRVFSVALIYVLISAVGGIYLVPKVLSTGEYNIYLQGATLAIGVYLSLLLLFILVIRKYYWLSQDEKIPYLNAYLGILSFCISVFFFQFGFSMAYRIVILFMGTIYEFCNILGSTEIFRFDSKKITMPGIILYTFMFYKVYDLFFVQLAAGQII